MSDETPPANQIGAFHWVKLGLTSATTIKWIVVLVLGAGTLTNETVQNAASELVNWSPVEEPLPIPEGETVVPDVVGINPQVRQSLRSMNSAVNAHKGELAALREDLRKLEERREAGSELGDATLEQRIVDLEEYHN